MQEPAGIRPAHACSCILNRLKYGTGFAMSTLYGMLPWHNNAEFGRDLICAARCTLQHICKHLTDNGCFCHACEISTCILMRTDYNLREVFPITSCTYIAMPTCIVACRQLIRLQPPCLCLHVPRCHHDSLVQGCQGMRATSRSCAA